MKMYYITVPVKKYLSMFCVLETGGNRRADLVVALPLAENIGMGIITYIVRLWRTHVMLRWE